MPGTWSGALLIVNGADIRGANGRNKPGHCTKIDSVTETWKSADYFFSSAGLSSRSILASCRSLATYSV
jgi:hypothetical protein